MNEHRRKNLRDAISQMQTARNIVDTAHDEEEACYDNLPEGLQESEQGEVMVEAIDNLSSAVDAIDDAIGYLEEIL